MRLRLQIVTEPSVPTPVAAPPNIRELVITLFELGREITAVLNLDELLHKIPQLIARITKFQAFAVYLLDPRAEELSIAYAVGYPDEVVWTLPRESGRGPGRHRGRRRAADSRQRRPRRSALPRSGARLELRARRAAAAQGARHRRAQPAQREHGPVHRDRRDAAAPVRRARRRRDRKRAAVRTGARVHEHARDAVGDRPRVRRDPAARRAAHAHRAP